MRTKKFDVAMGPSESTPEKLLIPRSKSSPKAGANKSKKSVISQKSGGRTPSRSPNNKNKGRGRGRRSGPGSMASSLIRNESQDEKKESTTGPGKYLSKA